MDRLLGVGFAVASLGLAACATREVVENFEPGAPIFYAGTRLNVAALRHDKHRLERFSYYGIHPPAYPALDLPLSFAADTLVYFRPRMIEDTGKLETAGQPTPDGLR